MTQDQRWMNKYYDIIAFMAENHRSPTGYNLEDRNAWSWLRQPQK